MRLLSRNNQIKHSIKAYFLYFSPALTGSKVIGTDVASPRSFTALTYISISENRTKPSRGMVYWWTPGGSS